MLVRPSLPSPFGLDRVSSTLDAAKYLSAVEAKLAVRPEMVMAAGFDASACYYEAAVMPWH